MIKNVGYELLVVCLYLFMLGHNFLSFFLITAQAALHALANIAGEKRPEEKKMLVSDAEECLRRLIFVAAATSPKLTPSVIIFIFFSYGT